jgi:hypothetical protein
MKPAYPASIDTFPTYADGDVVDASVLNDMHLVVLAIQGVIGKSGAKGSAADVSTRVAVGFNADGRLKNEVLLHPGLAWMDEYPGANSSTTDGAMQTASDATCTNLTSSVLGGAGPNFYATAATEERWPDARTAYSAFHHASPEGTEADMPVVMFSNIKTTGTGLAPQTFVRYAQDWTPGLGANSDQFEYAPASIAPRVNAYGQMRTTYGSGFGDQGTVFGYVMNLFPRKFSDKLWATRPLYGGITGGDDPAKGAVAQYLRGIDAVGVGYILTQTSENIELQDSPA